MPPLLPELATRQDYTSFRCEPQRWLPAMRTIAQRHRLPGAPGPLAHGATSGSALVAALGDHLVAKAQWPPWRGEADVERLVLPRVHERLGVTTPELVAHGEIDGWPYLVMTRVPGSPLREVWPTLSPRDRLHVASRVGEVLARLHALPIDGLESLATDWAAFVGGQVARSAAQHASGGLEGPLLEELPSYLAARTPLFPQRTTPVLLDADVTDEHVLLTTREGRWTVTGLIDFADAMLGFREYDFAAPGVYFLGGDPALVTAFLLSYGYREAELTQELRGRLMAYTLLHRFSDLSATLRRKPPRGPSGTLGDLEAAWWSFA